MRSSSFQGNGDKNGFGDGSAASSASVGVPYGGWADTLGNVYVCENFNNRVRKIDQNSVITTIAGGS